MFFTAIKTWASAKIIPIAFIATGLLAATAGTFFVMYKLEAKNLVIASSQVQTISKERDQIKGEYEGLQAQLEDERKRHAALEAEQQKNFDDFMKRQAELDKQKNDKVKKAEVKKNPKFYEEERQKAVNEYMNRMNCLSGNSVSCSKL